MKTYTVIQWATGVVGTSCLKGVVRHPKLELLSSSRSSICSLTPRSSSCSRYAVQFKFEFVPSFGSSSCSKTREDALRMLSDTRWKCPRRDSGNPPERPP